MPFSTDCTQHYIHGAWVPNSSSATLAVVNPADRSTSGQVALGSAVDVDAAVAAARTALPAWRQTSIADRKAVLQAILNAYDARIDDVADAIRLEMGAPRTLARKAQAPMGSGHLKATLRALDSLAFREVHGTTVVVREAIGVVGLITPWNWPINQIACKVAPALAAGCTMVLKASELAPYSARLWAEILHEAGVPAGVFNLVWGDGPGVGAALSAHPGVDMVSFTGSNRAGIEVARAAAPTVKRVHQELGGKSAHIVLPDADLKKAVTATVRSVMLNSGQSCNAPTRLLVPASQESAALEIAAAVAQGITVGDPSSDAAMGPVVSQAQWNRIQAYLQGALEEGARAVAGGLGHPEGLETGCYVRPTVLADVRPNMRVAQEEIFGPVLVVMRYDTVEEAIALANDTPYGLAAYVSGTDRAAVEAVALQLQAGQVNLNQAPPDLMAPFGGYKQSGNGREWGPHGILEFTEVKALLGAAAPAAA